jgi:hypothetical protein
MASRKLRLTKRSVEALKPPAKGSYIAWDTDCRSFGCRVLASGTKTFIFQPHGRGALRIGRADAIAPDEARDRARKMLAKVELGQTLPSRRTKPTKSPESESAPTTLGQLWQRYSSTSLLLRQPKTQQSYRSIWRCHLELMAAKRLADISEALVEDLHGEITRSVARWQPTPPARYCAPCSAMPGGATGSRSTRRAGSPGTRRNLFRTT